MQSLSSCQNCATCYTESIFSLVHSTILLFLFGRRKPGILKLLSKKRRKKEEKPENIQIGKVWKTIPVEISTSEFFLNSVKINMMIDEGKVII